MLGRAISGSAPESWADIIDISLHLTLMVDRICPLITVSREKLRKKCGVSWWSCLHEVVLVPSVPINREADGQITLN